MQGRRPGTELSAFVPTEIFDIDVCEMDFGEFERAASNGGLGLVVHAVDEYAHPLGPGAVGIDGASPLSSALDLDPLLPLVPGAGPVRIAALTQWNFSSNDSTDF